MSGKAICVFFGSKISLNPSHTGEAEAEWLQNSMSGEGKLLSLHSHTLDSIGTIFMSRERNVSANWPNLVWKWDITRY